MRTTVLALLTVLAPLAAAQAPGPPPPDLEAEIAASLAARPAEGGDPLARLGSWPEGPSYAVAVSTDPRGGLGDFLAWGSGRVLRAGAASVPEGELEIVLPGRVQDVALAGRYAYVALSHLTDDASRGLAVVDLLAAGGPAVVGTLQGLYAFGLHLAGTTLYLAGYDYAAATYRLVVVDVATPAAPVQRGTVAVGGASRGVDAVGTTVYVGAGSAGVLVVDASDPASPSIVRTASGADGYVRYLDVDASGQRLAVAQGSYAGTGSGGVAVFSLASPATPALTASVQTPAPVEDVEWGTAGVLFAAVSTDGLYRYDAQLNLLDRAYTTTANLVPGVNRVVRSSVTGRVYTADYYYGGFAYTPTLGTATLAWTGRSFAFGVVPDPADPTVVYVAAGSYGVARLQAHPDGTLVETGRAHDDTWNYTRDLAVAGGALYVADGFSGAHAVRKSTLQRTATLSFDYTEDVAATTDGRILFVAEGDAILVYNTATPSFPAGTLTGTDPYDFATADGHLYVGTRSGATVRIYAAPTAGTVSFVGTVAAAGPNVGVDAEPGRLVAYGGATEARVYSLAAPAVPAFEGTLAPLSGVGTDLHRGLYATVGQGGLRVYDAATPQPTTVLASVTSYAQALYDVALTDADVFVAAGSVGVDRYTNGLIVTSAPGPSVAVTLAVAPNPTAGPVTVEVAFDGGPVRAEILDVLGRTVRVLADGPQAPGSIRLAWDGRDAAGQRVATGVYVVRVTTDGGTQTRTVTVAR